VVLLLSPQELQKYSSFFIPVVVVVEGVGKTLGVLLALLVLRA